MSANWLGKPFLKTTFELFHFQENPDVEGFFDFELRPGISTQRNAIRVMERMGIPGDIVGKALALVAQQSDGDAKATW
jgi:DNA mismatch repair ATPase MutS